MIKYKIIIFCCDQKLILILKKGLSKYISDILIAENKFKFFNLFYNQKIDLVIVDDSIKLDILNLCNNVKLYNPVPIILCIKEGSNLFKYSNFFEIDNILYKPFTFKILYTLISKSLNFSKATIKASSLKDNSTLNLHLNENFLEKGTRKSFLTKTEFKILSLFLKQPDTSASKLFILKKVWGFSDAFFVKSNTVEMHVSKLKAKLTKIFCQNFSLFKRDNHFYLHFYK